MSDEFRVRHVDGVSTVEDATTGQPVAGAEVVGISTESATTHGPGGATHHAGAATATVRVGNRTVSGVPVTGREGSETPFEER